ncbi:acyl carrier protein [Actinomyces trachealis]|uniref:acyl carrier protein n=1 Tax=Actinomyces trachealis TaxID=2763540 RepID=UPI001892AC0C
MINLVTLLQGLLPKDVLANIAASPQDYLDRPLTHLGLDSLSTFEILTRIEQDLGHELDYETIDPDSLTTLRGLKSLVGWDEV